MMRVGLRGGTDIDAVTRLVPVAKGAMRAGNAQEIRQAKRTGPELRFSSSLRLLWDKRAAEVLAALFYALQRTG
jgi:hypothetical protein